MRSPTSGRGIASAGGADDELPDDAQVVFVSNAREDERWRRTFATMPAPLGERGVVVWSDEGARDSSEMSNVVATAG